MVYFYAAADQLHPSTSVLILLHVQAMCVRWIHSIVELKVLVGQSFDDCSKRR